jgi:transcription termination factor 2
MGLGKTITILAYLKQVKDETQNDSSDDEEDLTVDKNNNNNNKAINKIESESEHEDFTDFENLNVQALTNRIFKSTHKIKKYSNNCLKTLIVLPASLLHQWQNEIKSKFEKNAFKYEVYHGSERKNITKSQLERCDIVFTTYEIVSREANKIGKGTVNLSKSPLTGIEWTRIICDEGHRIKNSSSISNQAMCSLRAKYKIVITGTPIHNSMCDLYSLLKFINLYPLDDKSLFTYLFPSDKKSTSTLEEERRMNCWIAFLSSFLLLRRMKSDKIIGTDQNIVDLPKKSIELIKFELDEPERCIYDQIFKESKEKVKTLLINQHSNQFYRNSYGELNFSDVLVYILRLRQSCCHMNLIHQVVDMDELKNLQDELIEILEDEKETRSSHSTRTRFKSLKSIEENPELSICFNDRYLSSKLKIMIEKLNEILNEHPNDKIIIVSQWTSVLKILAKSLKENSVEYCEINGHVDLFERNRIVEYFNEKKHMDIPVMLLSLCAGGVGLNLIGANHMFLFDIHWNPALESQAADRIYRVGQTKDVKIYKFLCQNTIEESIYQVQMKKIDLAERFCNAKASNIPGLASAGNARLTVKDLRMLFDLI